MAYLYKRPGTAKCWIGWQVAGRSFQKSTGTSDEKKAKAVLHRIQYQEDEKREGRLIDFVNASFTGAPRIRPLTLVEVIDKYLVEEAARGVAPSTLIQREVALRGLKETLKADETGPMFADVGVEEVKSHLFGMVGKKSNLTINCQRKILSGFFIWGMKQQPKLCRENPCEAIRPFDTKRDETRGRRGFTLREIRDAYACADEFWRYAMACGWHAGLRLADVIQLKWSSIDLAHGLMTVIPNKTRKPVAISLAPQLRTVLASLRAKVKNVTPETYLWPEQVTLWKEHGTGHFSNQFRDVLVKAGVVKDGEFHLSFHSLRHNFVSNLKAAGAPESVAMALAGHQSKMISANYTHLPEQVLADAVEKLPTI